MRAELANAVDGGVRRHAQILKAVAADAPEDAFHAARVTATRACDDHVRAAAGDALTSAGGAFARARDDAYFRRADLPKTSRDDAAAATWIFGGDESRRRRGCDADIQRRQNLRRGRCDGDFAKALRGRRAAARTALLRACRSTAKELEPRITATRAVEALAAATRAAAAEGPNATTRVPPYADVDAAAADVKRGVQALKAAAARCGPGDAAILAEAASDWAREAGLAIAERAARARDDADRAAADATGALRERVAYLEGADVELRRAADDGIKREGTLATATTRLDARRRALEDEIGRRRAAEAALVRELAATKEEMEDAAVALENEAAWQEELQQRLDLRGNQPVRRPA